MQEIYDFMAGRDVSASYSDPAHKSQYHFQEFVDVENEVKRIIKESYTYVDGKLVINEVESGLDVAKVLADNPKPAAILQSDEI